MENRIYVVECPECGFSKKHYQEWKAEDDASDHDALVEGFHNAQVREETVRFDSTGYWWLPVAAVAFLLPLFFIISPLSELSESFTGILSIILDIGIGVGFLAFAGLWIISPVAVHFDRKRVYELSGWKPEWTYYLVIIFGIGQLLSILYLWKRHKFLGTP